MKINIVCVGSLKEKYLVQALDEYKKRISRFHTIKIIEIEEERLPKMPSDADISKGIVKEGEKIDNFLSGYICVLDINGTELTSVELSKQIDKVSLNYDTITFVIGGSYGLSNAIKSKANFKLSFSKMTFPHQLFRVMLLEQIYRASTISNNIVYHK